MDRDRAEQNFRLDAVALLAEVRAAMDHYRLDWDCYIVIRKPGSAESFLVAIEPDADEAATAFGWELMATHRRKARGGE